MVPYAKKSTCKQKLAFKFQSNTIFLEKHLLKHSCLTAHEAYSVKVRGRHRLHISEIRVGIDPNQLITWSTASHTKRSPLLPGHGQKKSTLAQHSPSSYEARRNQQATATQQFQIPNF